MKRTSNTASRVRNEQASVVAALRKPDMQLTERTAAFMRNTWEHDGADAATAMFYPAVKNDDSCIRRIHARALMASLAEDLADAPAHMLAASACEAMRQLKHTAPEITDRAEAPSDSGFAWFYHSLGIPGPNGTMRVIRALSWRLVTVHTGSTQYAQKANWPSARYCLWAHAHDDPPEWHGEGMRLTQVGIIPFGIRPPHPPAREALSLVHLTWMLLSMNCASRRRVRDRHDTIHVTELTQHADWTRCHPVPGRHRHLTNPLATTGTPVHRPVAVNGSTCAVCGGQLKWQQPHVQGPDGLPLRASRRTK